MIYNSQNLRSLSMVIEKGAPIPSASLPNLTHLRLQSEDGGEELQLLSKATFGKLECVHFNIGSKPIDDLLETFKGVALASSIQDTLLEIGLSTYSSWNPNYSSLLPFTRLTDLDIIFTCDGACPGVDDGIVIDLSQAMPKLQYLGLGEAPCHPFAGGVTAKGLAALAHNCPNLSSLRVHFQVASLTDPPIGLEIARDAGYSSSWTGCALTELSVGDMPVPEGSASIVALTLLRIFPQIHTIKFLDRIGEVSAWGEVEDMIRRSKEIVDFSSKCYHPTVPRGTSLNLLRSQIYDRQLSREGSKDGT